MIKQAQIGKLDKKLGRGDKKKVSVKAGVSYEKVRNFFQNKPVTDEDASKIIEATCDIIIENKKKGAKATAKIRQALA